MDADDNDHCETCDRCRDPGHCCRSFPLSVRELDREPALVVLAFLASVDQGEGAPGVPFMPLWRRPDGTWLYWCPNLGRDGRCLDYDNRPLTCRVYQPGSSYICVEHGLDKIPDESESGSLQSGC